MKIYVASSWRNGKQQDVVRILRGNDFQVYDFKNPKRTSGFRWESIDKNWLNWTPKHFVKMLQHPKAKKGYNVDYSNMMDSDVCVLVLPCGRSAHLEAGWFIGRRKPVHILLSSQDFEPELMYSLADGIHTGIVQLVQALKAYENME